MDKTIEDSIRQYGEKATYDALEDCNFVAKAAKGIADSINRGDPQLARYDWKEKTQNFDLEFIELVFRQINVDSMIDVISNRISSQYDRMVNNHEIKDFLNPSDFGDVEPQASLRQYAFEAHLRLKAIRDEEAAQRELEEQLKIVNKQALGHAHNVRPRHNSDGEPMVDDIYSEMADEMAPYFQEIESLKSLLADRDAEIERLNEELEAIEEKTPGLSAMPMAALFRAIAKLINTEEGQRMAESDINITKLAEAVETVTGFKSERIRQAMGSNEKSKGKNIINAAHKKKAANAVKDAMPRLAELVEKL